MTLLPPLAVTNKAKRRFAFCVFVALCLVAVLEFSLYNYTIMFGHLLILGGLINVLGAMGGLTGAITRKSSGLSWSLMLACGVCYGNIILGGIGIFFVKHIPSEIDSLTEIKYINVESRSASIEEEARFTRVVLLTSSVFLILAGILNGFQMRSMHRAVGEKRGSVALLQTFSMCAIPVALLFVLGGQFITDSQTLSSAPFTGIFMFVCGMLAMILALFAFVGSAFEYRRLLGIFNWMSFFIGIGLIGSSMASFFMGDQVQDHILSNWESIRMVLPPTIQAKYDRSQFISLVKANLKSFAYVGVITGWMLLMQSGAASTLKNIIDASKKQLAEDKLYTKNLKEIHGIADDDDFHPEEHSSHPHFALRRRWHMHFKTHRRRHRIAMRIGCGLCTIVLMLFLTLMATSVIFASKCGSLSKAGNSAAYPLSEPSTSDGIVKYKISSTYSSGLISILQGNQTTGELRVDEYAIKVGDSVVYLNYSTDTDQEQHATSLQTFETVNDTVLFSIAPIKASRVLWLDLTCQEAGVTVELPATSQQRTLSLYSETSMEVNLTSYASSSVIHTLNASSSRGNLDFYGLSLGSGGMALSTTSGEIVVTEATMDAASTDGHSLASLNSLYGSLVLQNASLKDTILNMETQVGQIVLSDVISVPTHGWSYVTLETYSGGIYSADLAANWIKMKSVEGKIEGNGLTAAESEARVGRFTAETKTGSIELHDVAAGGYVHAETHTGDIYVHLKSYSFRGLFYIRSERGQVSVRKGKYSFDSLTMDNSTESNQVTGSINCGDGSDQPNCYYVGDIHLLSFTGDIQLVIGCEDTECS